MKPNGKHGSGQQGASRETAGGHAAEETASVERLPRSWRIWFALAVLAIAAGGVWFYRVQAQTMRERVENELVGIARLKGAQITAWRKDQLNDAALLGLHPFLVRHAARFLAAPAAEVEQDLSLRLDSVAKQHDYVDILLLDAKGNAVFSLNDKADTHKGYGTALAEALRKGKPVFTKVRADSAAECPQICVLVPLEESAEEASSPVGALVLVNDPAHFLFPLIEFWPAPTRTAETLLMQRETDELVILNEPRHRPNTENGLLRIPLRRTEMPAVKTVREGRTDFRIGKDYRGAEVASVVLPVRDSPWLMESKVDVAEVFAVWRLRSILLLTIFVVLLALLGAVVLVLQQGRSKAYYHALYRSKEALRRLEWMLTAEHKPTAEALPPEYGDLVALNEHGSILRAVGREALKDIVSDYLDLLETSAAVYERNGDYACGIFSSGWCRLMDGAARRLCETEDNREALESGKWLCHESCWWDASKIAIDSGEPVDVECPAGLRLYAVPIRAGDEIVGAVNFGYGDPPRDAETLGELARKYKLDPDALLHEAEAYESRPTYIVNMAKRRTEVSARLIGETVVRYHAEERVRHLNCVLRAIRDVNQLIVREDDSARLIEAACSVLVEHRGYRGALVALSNGHGRVTQYAQAGMDEVFPPLAEWLDGGELPPCCAEAAAAGELRIVSDPETTCGTCPLADICPGVGVMCAPLRHSGATHGYLAVSADANFANDNEEAELFLEVAGDLGYALNSLAVKASRREEQRANETMRNQLFQAQKMESVGRLAGGVAHDFNNLLMGIMNYVDICRDELGPDHPVREYLNQITHDAQRSANLTRQLLAFARKQIITPKVVYLNEAVESMLNMLQRLIGESIELVWMPYSGLWPVKIDPGQVDQVLANLCVNARDAIEGVGCIEIKTDNDMIDDDYCTEHPDANPGSYAMLVVSDDGRGMDKDTLRNLFEPFFTTKPFGEGTGLGLATVYGIVKQNDGFVNVYSEPGEGTTFRIYLPSFRERESTEKSASDTEQTTQAGSETVFVVEDEPAIRKTLKRHLDKLGYTTLAAGTPEEALNLAAEHGDTIDLLITDVVMPGMSGRQLAERLVSDHPGMKVLYMSGYTANVIAHRGILEESVEFLSKPFTRDELARKVREMLD